MNPVHEFAFGEIQQDGLEKEAGFWGDLLDTGKKSLPTLVAQGALMAATPFAMMGAFEGYDAIKGAIQKSRGFKKMVDANPELQDVPADRLKLMYNSVYHTSPHVAVDPLAAGSVVGHMAAYGGKVDPKTIAELASTEQRAGAQMSPFRQQMVSNMTSAMSGGVIDPLTAARIAESKASGALKTEELGAFGGRLSREKEEHKRRGEQFAHQKSVDLATAMGRGEELGLRREEFGHRQGIDALNVGISRRNVNEQERHNERAEQLQRMGSMNQARQIAQKREELGQRASEFGALQGYRGQQQSNWEADRGIGTSRGMQALPGYTTGRSTIGKAEAAQAGVPRVSVNLSELFDDESDPARQPLIDKIVDANR